MVSKGNVKKAYTKTFFAECDGDASGLRISILGDVGGKPLVRVEIVNYEDDEYDSDRAVEMSAELFGELFGEAYEEASP